MSLGVEECRTFFPNLKTASFFLRLLSWMHMITYLIPAKPTVPIRKPVITPIRNADNLSMLPVNLADVVVKIFAKVTITGPEVLANEALAGCVRTDDGPAEKGDHNVVVLFENSRIPAEIPSGDAHPDDGMDLYARKYEADAGFVGYPGRSTIRKRFHNAVVYGRQVFDVFDVFHKNEFEG